MARKKVAPQIALESWGGVDCAMREIIECEGCMDEINAEWNRVAAEAKAAADQRTKPILERIAVLESQIQKFVVAHRNELGGKTRKLNFGQTGFRSSTKLVIPAGTEPDIVKALRKYKMKDCIKVKETVDRNVLRKYKLDDIDKVGACLKTSEKFWYEVDKERVQPPEPQRSNSRETN